MWSFQGRLLRKQSLDRVCQLLWRPRPPTMLSDEQIKVTFCLIFYMMPSHLGTSCCSNATWVIQCSLRICPIEVRYRFYSIDCPSLVKARNFENTECMVRCDRMTWPTLATCLEMPEDSEDCAKQYVKSVALVTQYSTLPLDLSRPT